MDSLLDIVRDVMVHTGLKERKRANSDKNVIDIEVCPFCNNGKSKKPRAYILMDGKMATYYCHKGKCPSGGSLSLGIFAKKRNYGKGQVNYFKFTKLGNYKSSEQEDVSSNLALNYEKIDVSQKLEIETRHDYTRYLQCGLLDNNLKDYLRTERKIKDDLSQKMLRNIDNGNLIIPYYNKTLEDIYYLQERSNKDGGYYFLKVVGCDNENFIFKKIYNLYNVDETKPIIAFEGVLDTFFVENSISMGGSKNVAILDKLKIFYNSDKIYYIQDNDKAGKDSAFKFMENGGYVFQWYLFLRDHNINTYVKDVNDLYKKNILTEKLKYSDLQKYFTNNIRMKNLI